VLFALTLIIVSPAVNRLTRTRTRDSTTIPLADLSWPLLRWVRYVAAIRLVRILAGPLLCGTPLWTAYVRWNGARIGRRVYINSLSLSDHNLLTIGDDVVIGAEVRMSGHTVEEGLLKTGRVEIGDGATVGLGSIIGIGVRVGTGTQLGAFTLVPKFVTLEDHATYAGIPARPLPQRRAAA
jgi:non-ribosomal peptide synthetase-like protein